MSEVDLSEIGARGLVVAEKDNIYRFMREHEWLALGPLANEPQAMTQLKELGVIVARVQNGMYVDLELLNGLKPAAPPAPGAQVPAPQQLKAERSVFLRHEGKVYQVPESKWDLIDAGFEGAAGVVTTRGSVVAAVPPNPIPAGTYCVVVNMAGI